MGKYNQKGVVDAHLVVALAVIVVAGGLLLWRISTGTEGESNVANQVVEETVSEIDEVIERDLGDAIDTPEEEVEAEPAEEEEYFNDGESDDAAFPVNRVTDFSEYVATTELKTVNFSGASFQVPSDWEATEEASSYNDGNWLILNAPSSERVMVVLDFDATEGLSYTYCEYYLNTPVIYYDTCENGAESEFSSLWASTILSAEDAAPRPPHDEGALWRDFIVWDQNGKFYYQAKMTLNPGDEDFTTAFDYALETFTVN